MLRAERALQLIPDLEALTPLRALVFAAARPSPSGNERLHTLGKRGIEPADLRARLPEMIEAVTRHAAAIGEAVVDALECERRGDKAGAVRWLLRGGERERDVGRTAPAQVWFARALGLAEELRERQPEIEALLHLGDLCGSLTCHDDAARWYQRALALAEAEYETDMAVRACLGLGRVAMMNDVLAGAESWYRRGLAIAGKDATLRRGQLEHQLGIVASRRHDPPAARTHLAHAHALLDEAGDPMSMASVRRTEAMLARQDGDEVAAESLLREARACAERSRDAPWLTVVIGIELAEVLIAQGRYLEADDELRRQESESIRRYYPRSLARAYALLGKLRGLEGEEDGFVFFEMALELSANPSAPASGSLAEVDVLIEYGAFRRRMGQAGEARAYLERAQELLATLGDATRHELVAAELQRLGEREAEPVPEVPQPGD